MDTSTPDKNTRNSPRFRQPGVVCRSPVSGFSRSRSPSGSPFRPAPTLSSRSPAAQAHATMPISWSALDVHTADTLYPPDVKLSEQNATVDSDPLADNLVRMVDISQQVLNILQNSSVIEKGTSDNRSRFWTVYQKVAEEHDNEFFELHDNGMDIVLLFAALFSAVNTTFITTMGPSDSITTNALLTQIITLMVMESNGTSIGDIFPVSAPPAYSSGQVWFQALAYASLSFSLLAAFGAVLGKQWLRFYKLERFGRGSLEERGKNRQMKLEGLEAWHFDAVLQMFPVLLQISLLLFSISLSSYIWTQQRTITAIVIVATVLGCMFYAFTLFASLLSPVCPFQTPASFILRMTGAFLSAGSVFIKNDTDPRTLFVRVCSFFRSKRESISRLIWQLLNPNPSSDCATEAAIRWLLTTSTDPENIAAAAALIPTTSSSLPPQSDIASYCQRLQDTFVSCFETNGRPRPLAEERAVHCGQALNHLCLAGAPIDTASQNPTMWHAWRSIILPRTFDHCKTLASQLQVLSGKGKQISSRDRQICQANTRTALRMIIAAAGDGFVHPDEDKIIWRGRFTWNGDCRTAADFDWLVDYLVSCPNDDIAMGDSILALSAMNRLGSRDRASAYLEALVFALTSDRPRRVRYAVLRTLSDSRAALANLDSIEDEKIRHLLLEKLSPALLSVIPMGNDPHVTNYFRDDAYLGLIVALASNKQWCKHLVADRHIERCVFILNHLDESSRAPFHLAAIFGQVYATCPGAATFEAVAESDFSFLAKLAWQSVLELQLYDEDECTSALPNVVNFTVRQKVVSMADLRDIHGNVRVVADKLKRRRKYPTIILAMEDFYTQLTTSLSDT